MRRPRDAIAGARRLARAVRDDPVEVALAVPDILVERTEHGRGGSMPWPPCPYDEADNWEPVVHEILGAPWPCPEAARFLDLGSEMVARLTSGGMSLGRGAFAGWGDGDPGLARGVWCIPRHLRPTTVVETGVGR